MEMAQHMLNALLERITQLKEEYASKPDELTCKLIALNIADVMKNYTMDRRNVLNLFGTQDLSLNDLKAISELDYN